MTTIYLTRHGETEWNLQGKFQGFGDSPLTARGIKQAEGLAKRIDKLPIDAIYSSDLKRAKHTAEILRGNRDIPIIEREALREKAFGSWEGLTYYDIATVRKVDLENYFRNPSLNLPEDGEAYQDFTARVLRQMSTIEKDHPGQSVLVVTHGLVLKVLLAYYEGIDLENIHDIPLPKQASLTMVNIHEGRAELMLAADTSHEDNE